MGEPTRSSPQTATHLPCWCGRERLRDCLKTPRFGLVQCRNCGCYRIDPPPLQRDEDSEDFYSAYYAAKVGPSAGLKPD
jgi:hypothetical protein